MGCKRNRILVTTDKDFEEMIWQQGQNHCGVLRIENLPRLERMALVKDVLTQHGEDLKSGSIVIATQKKISYSTANIPTLIASNSSIPTRTVTPILFFSVLTHLLIFVCTMN